MMRRTVDIFAALVLLVVTAPIMVAAAMLVLLTSGRPVFFGHERLGRNGRRFRCWKIRTMRPDAQDLLAHDEGLRRSYVRNGFKIPAREDPRVTNIGRFLRRWYVDELPQLVNVLAGCMSLVGPRPIVPDELAEWGTDASDLLRAKPGIVGAWTSHGRARPGYPERIAVELDYVRRATPATDIAILIRTIPVVLRGQDDS